MGLALEESVKEDEDQVEEAEGVPFVLEKKVVPHLDNKTIDYITSPQEGFIIRKEGKDPGCGDCSC